MVQQQLAISTNDRISRLTSDVRLRLCFILQFSTLYRTFSATKVVTLLFSFYTIIVQLKN